MKVCMIAAIDGDFGVPAYTRDLVEALGEHAQVTIEPLRPGIQSPAAYQALAERANRADVVHIQHQHGLFGAVSRGERGFWTLRYAIEKPAVITAHETLTASELARLDGARHLHLLLIARLHSKRFRDSIDIAPFVTGRCVTLTEADRGALIGRGAQPRFVHAIPAGAPGPPFPVPDSRRFRERHALGDARIVLQSLRAAANPTAAQILDEVPPEVAVLFAGVAGEPSATEDVLARLRAHKSARMIAGLSSSELAEAIAAAEVVIAGSDTAGGPRDVLLALSFGKPVLAPDLPALREIQERVPCLRMVRAGDAGHLAACLKAVLSNEIGRAEMSDRGRRYAEQFSWRWAAERTMEVYRLAISDEAGAVPS